MFPLRDTLPSHGKPAVTALLIAANVLVFLYQLSLESYALNHFIGEYGLVPARFDPLNLVTSQFLHGGWWHLIGNMWFLWIYGDNVEDILGHGKYFLFYLLCGIAAALSQYLASPDSRVPMVGASGAIAGVMGAYLVKFPHARIVTLVFVFFFVTTVQVPASLILGYWFLIQVFSGVGSMGYSNMSQGGVAWFAHVGGFVAGVVLILTMRTRQRYSRRWDLTW
ncbi:MAG: rhomboid family intramembrane serine protease [Bryobacterales bacterium]|nr:rhomboid family intramembrane serine protease [Bryobacterales bacterium]